MAIMAMGMVKKSKLAAAVTMAVTIIHPASANDWVFNPELVVNETYTDNVELKSDREISSLVSQTGFNINTNYQSRLLNFSIASRSTYAFYSHDHDLDDDIHAVNSSFSLKLGELGFSIIGSADIDNRSRNSAKNALADIVTADTVQVETYSGGLEFDLDNSRYVINSRIQYNLTESEDNIGNFEGYSSSLSSKNGLSARNVFWDINAQYQEKENNGFEGVLYKGEAKLGVISKWNINPFIRYFDEDNSGNIQSGQSTESNSYGIGVRWAVTPRTFIDISYNSPIGNALDIDGKEQKDYIDAFIAWQPTNRTSLTANYSQRFFGDTYGLTLNHKNKRLSNSISYKEDIRSFTRQNYERILLGNYWCPISDSLNLNECFIQDDQNIDFDSFQLLNVSDYEITEDNVFSLYKTLTWDSELNLSRTSFKLTAELSNRTDLHSLNEDDKIYVNFSASRAISGRSNIAFGTTYTDNWLRKGTDSERRDRYRQASLTYIKSLNKALNFNIDLAHVNRSSNQLQYNYEETRVTFKITKDF